MKKFLNVLENLQNAFRMPDGASEMTRNLASLDFPQLTSVLPYRDYDRDSGLFVNRSTVGFLLRAEPLIGANEQIVYVLEDLIKSKLPRKTPISFHLVSSKLIGDQLDRGLSEFRWQGKHADKFNRITRAYYQRAAQQQFNSPTGLPLTLRDYRLYISYCVKAKKRTAAVMTEVAHTLKVLRSSLDAAKIYTQAADDQELATLVHGMLNARHDQLYPDEVRVGKFDELHQRCVDQRIGIDVRPDDVLISLADRQGSVTSTRAMNFMLENNPDMFMLWMGGDNLSNLLSPDLTIASPFVITMVMEAEDQVATQGEATRKYLDREKKANSPYATLFPGVAKQAKEWKEIREHLNSNQTCIVRYYYNVTTFCPDTDEDALVCEQQVINTFKKNGIDLFSPTYMQFRNWIAMIPFIHAEGLWEDIKMGGATCRAESIQAVNLLPVVADNRLCQGGLLTPSYRNQLAFLDIYGDGMGNTNYNMAVTGTSGAGKTGLVQPILRSVLDSGGIAWVFDMGDGYKSFCENVGGTYLDGKSLKFNPFANISNINESGERIRDQLAVLASPNGTLDEVHHSLLLRGVQEAWEAHKEKARIDHVVQKLTAIREDDKYQNSPGITNRLDEIIELLGKYCSWGIYGEYFNSDEPSLT
ncbi:TPA: TraC family protein, partial [Escherichia coli]|nr:TraC family protein [Escherichia coli]